MEKSRESILNEVKQIIGLAVDLPPESLTTDANLYYEYGLDSLGAIYIFVEIQDTFGTPEPQTEEEYISLNSIDKIVDLVESSMEDN